MTRAGHHTMMGGGAAAMRCAVFDGTIASRMATESVGINPSQQPQISVAAWILCSDYGSSNIRCVSLFDNASDKKTGPQFNVTNGSTGGFGLIFQWVADFGFYEVGNVEGTWHHYAFSFAPGATKRYFDGSLVKTDTNASTWLRGNASANLVLSLGSGISSTTGGLVGKIANVNLFDYEISAQEAIFLASKPDAVPTTAYHQYLFTADDGTDTGTSTSKWNLAVGSTTVFEKLSTGGGGRIWLLLCRSLRARRSLERRAA